MSAGTRLAQVQAAARRHALLQIALFALPWLALALVLAWRIGSTAAWLLPLLPLVVAVVLSLRIWQRMDRAWLARALDTHRSDMEDSADLLVGLTPPHGALQRLQRERLQARLDNGPPPDLRQPWHRRGLVASLLVALLGVALVLLWPASDRTTPLARLLEPRATGPAQPPRLTSHQLEIHPPRHTGLPVQRGTSLSAKVVEGSELHWTLQFTPDAKTVALRFQDGSRLALARSATGQWAGRKRIDRATLYRIEPAQPRVNGASPLYRIDVTADRAPQVTVLPPTQPLTLLTPGQRRWTVAFDATDDYGLSPTARLRVTRTEGSGENITAHEQVIPLRGAGPATRKRYTHTFDLAALGLVAGDDLIAQLIVSDNAPTPHVVNSPSLILRWPPEALDQASGLDGLMQKAMPAYFRSQRQIIIDAEALLKEKPRLSADDFLKRSDAIGVDQRLLRLRYGQFLGEETEGAPKTLPTNDAPSPSAPPLPTNDAPEPSASNTLPTNDAPASATDDAHAEHDDAHAADDGHDHGDEPPPQRAAVFGEETQVLERFGHTHDIPEAATLLDPKTRELLRAALDAMWASEVQLRLGHPDTALPQAYRALGFIKQVQQSERIYLSKTGPELPPIDPARRLTGDRAGLSGRRDPMQAAPAADTTVADAWLALSPGAAGTLPDLDALERWLASHPSGGGDPLALAASIDAVRSAPDCRACRERLRSQLWPWLGRPPGAPAPRAPASRLGDAYLDALGKEAQP